MSLLQNAATFDLSPFSPSVNDGSWFCLLSKAGRCVEDGSEVWFLGERLAASVVFRSDSVTQAAVDKSTDHGKQTKIVRKTHPPRYVHSADVRERQSGRLGLRRTWVSGKQRSTSFVKIVAGQNRSHVTRRGGKINTVLKGFSGHG
jgi:hypothetical protein